SDAPLFQISSLVSSPSHSMGVWPWGKGSCRISPLAEKTTKLRSLCPARFTTHSIPGERSHISAVHPACPCDHLLSSSRLFFQRIFPLSASTRYAPAWIEDSTR